MFGSPRYSLSRYLGHKRRWTGYLTRLWRWIVGASLWSQTPENEQRLKDRWQDLCVAVDADRLTYDEAVEMYELMRDTPMVRKRAE